MRYVRWIPSVVILNGTASARVRLPISAALRNVVVAEAVVVVVLRRPGPRDVLGSQVVLLRCVLWIHSAVIRNGTASALAKRPISAVLRNALLHPSVVMRFAMERRTAPVARVIAAHVPAIAAWTTVPPGATT